MLQGDNANFVTQLQKINATGGTTTVRHNVQYALSNQPFLLYPSDWNVNLEVEARQPLLRGAGVQFNRIAGPGAQPGQYNGVMLARINTDIALADFEAAVRNLVSDTESAYWELYFYYRSLDAVNAGRESALQTWQKGQCAVQRRRPRAAKPAPRPKPTSNTTSSAAPPSRRWASLVRSGSETALPDGHWRRPTGA